MTINNPTIKLAGCIIPDKSGKILLLHRQKGLKDQWETPGGKLEPGESPEQAAIRELKEEIGVTVQLISLIGENDFTEKNQSYHYFWYQAKIISGTPSIQEPQTFTKIKYFTWDEISAMHSQLSPNTKNLSTAYQKKLITLKLFP
jgi:8-oxo-dGTP diphosphatase